VRERNINIARFFNNPMLIGYEHPTIPLAMVELDDILDTLNLPTFASNVYGECPAAI
jgi:hypothetical protein